MPIKYDPAVKAKAVRLVREHDKEYDTQWVAIKAISARLGMSAETLRKWVRQAEVDDGQAVGVSTRESQELRELRKKNRELEETIVISGPHRVVYDVGDTPLKVPGNALWTVYLRCP